MALRRGPAPAAPRGLTGAGLGERAPDRRQAQRNGYRPRRWDTRVVDPELSGAAPPGRAGAGRGRPGGLGARHLDPQGRPAGRPAGAASDEQGHRQPARRRIEHSR